MSEKLLRWFSGIDNLKGIFIFRFIIGLVFILYGFITFYYSGIEDIWTKISVSSALWGLGLMFTLDGQAILRQYFSQSREDTYTQKPFSFLSFIIGTLFLIGGILFFIKFYVLEAPSLYAMTIFLIAILIILVFQKNISHFELSNNKLLVKMKEDKEEDYNLLESKKKEWKFGIGGIK